MNQALIIQQTKNALQSGRSGTGVWHLEYEPAEAKRADPLMGWAGSGDTSQQVRLTFPSLDAAKAYATKNGLSVTIVPAAARVLKVQAYADNFR